MPGGCWAYECAPYPSHACMDMVIVANCMVSPWITYLTHSSWRVASLGPRPLAWRTAICEGTKHFEKSRLQSLDDKRSARKNTVPNPSTAVPCQLWSKICTSTFGLQAHMRKHQHWCVIFEIGGLLLLDTECLWFLDIFSDQIYSENDHKIWSITSM